MHLRSALATVTGCLCVLYVAAIAVRTLLILIGLVDPPLMILDYPLAALAGCAAWFIWNKQSEAPNGMWPR